MHRHYLYYETGGGTGGDGKPRVGRSSRVRGAGMVARGCVVGEDCRLEGTVLGRNCRIDDGSTVVACHLWDSVRVGAGATVLHSILGDRCVVKPGAFVNRGCVVGAGCVVGEGIVLPEYTRLTLREEKQDDFDDGWDDDDEKPEDGSSGGEDENVKKTAAASEIVVSDAKVVGPDGKGRVWEPSLDDYEVDFDGNEERTADELASIVRAHSIGFAGTSNLLRDRHRAQREHDEEDDFSVDEDGLEMLDADLGEYYADGPVTFEAEPTTAPAAVVGPVIIGRQRGVDVVKELKLICLEYEPTSPIENLAIELNSFKFSQNASYADCTMAATMAILERMNIRSKGPDRMTDGRLVADFKSSLEHWAPLLRKMSIGLDEEKAIVVALERCATQNDTEMGDYLGTGASFRFLLQTLHDDEIVSEDAILSWAAERREQCGRDDGDRDSAVVKLFQLQPVQDFLEWLAEESEEDSDDDDEEDSEDD